MTAVGNASHSGHLAFCVLWLWCCKMVLIKIICIFLVLMLKKRGGLWEGKVIPDVILSGIVLNVDTHGK